MYALISSYDHELDDRTLVTMLDDLKTAKTALTDEVRQHAAMAGYEFRDDSGDEFGIDLTRRNDMCGVGYVNVGGTNATWTIYEVC